MNKGLAGEFKKGIWIPAEENKPKNPKGNNQYTDKPKAKKLGPIEEFVVMPTIKQKAIISELGKEVFKLEAELRPIQTRFRIMKTIYESKHFDWELSPKFKALVDKLR